MMLRSLLRLLAHLCVIAGLIAPTLLHGATAIEGPGTASEKFAACEGALPVPRLSGLVGSARVVEARKSGRSVESCRIQSGMRPTRMLRPDFIALGRAMDSEDETLSLASIPAESSLPAIRASGASDASGGSQGPGTGAAR